MAKHLTLTCFILAAFSLLLLVESDCIVFRKPAVKTEWAGYLCCTWRVGMALRSTSTCFSRVTPVNDASLLAKNLDYTIPSLYIFSMGFIYVAYTGSFPGQPNSWAEICPPRPLGAVGEAGCHATRLFFHWNSQALISSTSVRMLCKLFCLGAQAIISPETAAETLGLNSKIFKIPDLFTQHIFSYLSLILILNLIIIRSSYFVRYASSIAH